MDANLELIAQLRSLDLKPQTPDVVCQRKLLVKKIIDYEVFAQGVRLRDVIEQDRIDYEAFLEAKKKAWDEKWDAGIVETVLRVQQQLQENEDGRYKIISIG